MQRLGIAAYSGLLIRFLWWISVLLCIGAVSYGDRVFADVEVRTTPVWDGTLRRIFVPILMYHYVSELPEDADEVRTDLTVTPDMFRAHMRYLSEQGYETVSLYELNDALAYGKALPAKPVILTFDDGYIDHYTNVFPILEAQGYTGTFFIITSRADAQDPAYMTWEQISEMSGTGMSMESHTKTHPDLRERSRDFLIYEILGSYESLKAFTGVSNHMFAYPVGRYDAMTLQIVGELPIWRAVTTQSGALQTTDNRLEMPRMRIHGTTTVGGLAGLLRRG
ncbi:MAG: polysaccharide deacetylase family protein [Anaerolineae bacterium]|nr:polysaccharide deacetylase family protein [Anaerolineae bacterium]